MEDDEDDYWGSESTTPTTEVRPPKPSTSKVLLGVTVGGVLVTLVILIALVMVHNSLTSSDEGTKDTKVIEKVEKSNPSPSPVSKPQPQPDLQRAQTEEYKDKVVTPVITNPQLSPVQEVKGIVKGKFIDASSDQLFYWLMVEVGINPEKIVRVDLPKSDYDSYIVGESVKLKIAYDSNNRLVLIQ